MVADMEVDMVADMEVDKVIAIIWTARNSAGGGRQWGFEVSRNPAPSTSNTTQSSTPHHL